MKNPYSRGLVVGLATLMLGLGSWLVTHGSGASDTPGTVGLQAIGQSGAEAIPLKVWTDKESGEAFREGDRAIISFQAGRTGYLTVLSVSSDGSVHIYFPNKEVPNNVIQQGKVYTLFGDDSSLRLVAGQKSKSGGVVFYLSPKQFSLDPLRAVGDQKYIVIPASARDNINILENKLKSVSREPGFNRVVVPLPGVDRENLEAKVSVLPARAKEEGRKALPGGVESSKPEVVTGAAGLKPVREEGRQR